MWQVSDINPYIERMILTTARCIPKMDHHCPWTNNCASIRTFPHFIRYLLYAVVSISYLEYLLFLRDARVWENRKLPSVRGLSTFHRYTNSIVSRSLDACSHRPPHLFSDQLAPPHPCGHYLRPRALGASYECYHHRKLGNRAPRDSASALSSPWWLPRCSRRHAHPYSPAGISL